MKFDNQLLLAIATATLVFGCHAEDRSAPKNPIVTSLQSYGQLGSETFQNNKVFFWRGPDAEAMRIVMQAAKDIDFNDDAGVEARVKMTQVSNDLGTAIDTLNAAVTDDATKTALSNLRDLVDEATTSLTEDEINDNIKKTESDLAGTNNKLTVVAKSLTPVVRDLISTIGRLGIERARLAQTDPARDDMQKQIDDLNKTLPADLPPLVLSAKTAREALLVTYEGHFRDKARRVELAALVADAAKAVPALPPETQARKLTVDSLYAQKEAQFQVQYRIGKKGEALVDAVIGNTDYFENLLERVTIDSRGGSLVVTMVDFPEKGTTLSTNDGTITNTDYSDLGSVIRFEAHPVPNGPYFKFRVSRTRPEITDGRHFYQGEMDLCKFGTNCDTRSGNLLRHGMAKFVTSN